MRISDWSSDVCSSDLGAEGLENARLKDLAQVEISLAGRGPHFPTLDADLYIPALLDGIFGSARWAAAKQGQAGGKVKSEAKARASRENGSLAAVNERSISQRDRDHRRPHGSGQAWRYAGAPPVGVNPR